MALAAHSTVIKVSGTAVPVTNEACTEISGSNPNKLFRVTTTARRCWDPSAAVTVKDGGVTVSASLYSFSYLFGEVQFAGYTVTGAVTVDGSYLPLNTLASVNEFRFSGSADLGDVTTFDSGGYRAKQTLLKDGSGSLKTLASALADVDPDAGGTQSLHGLALAGTPKLFESNFGAGGAGNVLRAWMMLEGGEVSAAIDGLVEQTWNFQTAPQRAGASVAFGS